MRLNTSSGRVFILVVMCLFLSACATYYRKNAALMEALYKNDLSSAEKLLSNPKLEKPNKDILLYYFNKGTILWMADKPQESSKYFQKADYYIEDYQKNYALKAASFLVNAKVEPYEGESFEKIMLHYFSATNYLRLNQLDEAMVECKRMLLKLEKITDTYKGKNKYKADAFVHNLMGMIYDAQGDYNNAFIAYRNAYNIYSNDYVKLLGTPVPEQLKHDLIRSARLTGFSEDARKYTEEFKINYDPATEKQGSVIVLWNNGFGPVKDEWSINFTVVPGGGGWVTFVNLDLGLSFPFYLGDDNEKTNSIAGLRFIRVAFPKYVTRLPLYSSATVSVDSLGMSKKVETAEDINAIAYKSLEDRMLKEMAESLLRLALKQIAESQVRKQNELAGAGLSLVNAITEQADTRNWQTLPYEVGYTRVYLPQGTHTIHTKAKGNNQAETTIDNKVSVSNKNVTFQLVNTMQFNGYKQ